MGGGEKAKANQMSDAQYARENQASDQFSNQQRDERIGARGREDDLWSSLSGGYEDLANQRLSLNDLGGAGSGGVSAPQYTRDPGFGTAGANYRNFATTGGIDPESMRKGEGTMQEFMKTGGIDDARKASIEGNIRGLQDFGKTGGLDAAAMARMQGNGGYDEFAKTGGLSDADRANIRSRATSVIPAQMAPTNANADRMRSVQGGYGPGAAALKSRLLRSSNVDNAAAARDAELGIMGQVNEGRKFGIQGVSDSAQKAQGLRTGNMLGGMQGAAAPNSDYAKMLQSGKMWGADSITGAEKGINELAQQGKMFGTTGTMNLAESNQGFADRQASANASAANANSGNSLATNKYLAEFNRDNQMMGLGGLSSLRGQTPAEIAMYDQNNLQNRGMSNSSQNATIGDKLTNNKSGMDNFGNILQGVGSIAGGVSGGLGDLQALRKPKSAQTGT